MFSFIAQVPKEFFQLSVFLYKFYARRSPFETKARTSPEESTERRAIGYQNFRKIEKNWVHETSQNLIFDIVLTYKPVRFHSCCALGQT